MREPYVFKNILVPTDGTRLSQKAVRQFLRDYNRRHGWDLQVAPTAMRGASGAAPGVSISGQF